MRYKPQGHATRGKTARNRLRRSDIFLLLTEGRLIRQADRPGMRDLYVDLGYGFEPFTTLETAERLRVMNPKLSVLGVEIEPERVRAAEPYCDGLTDFRLGGFNLPLRAGEGVRILRAFNVLRQYDEDEVYPCLSHLGKQLIPGGMLLEGTSNPFGMVWTANIVRKRSHPPFDVYRAGFVFSTNFHMGFEPELFQPVLTKNYIHRCVEGETIFDFLERWKAACRNQSPMRSYGLRSLFRAAAEELSKTYSLDLRPQLLEKGFLLWRFEEELTG